MELYGFIIDDKLVDEIADRILNIYDHAVFDNTPLGNCRPAIIKAIEDVLWCHNIRTIDREHVFTDFTKEDI